MSWDLIRLRHVLREIDERGHPDETVLSVYRDRGVIPKASRTDNYNKTPENLGVYKLVQPNDLVVNKMKAWQGSVAVSRHCGIVSGDYMVCRITSSAVDSGFLHHLLRSHLYVAELRRASTGIRPSQWRLYWDGLADVRVRLPALPEQRAIAGYLDYETARIDSLIAKKRRMMDLLTERLTVCIRQAISQGLTASELRATDVEIVPRLPTHWELTRARYVCRVETGAGDTVQAMEDGDYPFFVRSDTVERSDKFLFDTEAVLTSGDGAGVAKVFHHYSGKFNAHQRVYVMHEFRRVLGRYYYYCLRSLFPLVALDGSAKSTVDSVRRHMLTDMPVPLPPFEEQALIVRVLDREVARTERLLTALQKQLKLLDEHRQALITAAVTGELEVPGVVA